MAWCGCPGASGPVLESRVFRQVLNESCFPQRGPQGTDFRGENRRQTLDLCPELKGIKTNHKNRGLVFGALDLCPELKGIKTASHGLDEVGRVPGPMP